MVGTYHVKNEFGTDEYDIKTATKGNYEMGGGGGVTGIPSRAQLLEAWLALTGI